MPAADVIPVTVGRTPTVDRRLALLLGACIGLASGFAGLYFSTLPVFLKPMAHSLGWSRADISAVLLASMLGLAVGAPFQGLLIDRWGPRRVIGASVILLAAALWTFSRLPNSRLIFGCVSFGMGIVTAATGPSGYLSVLPRWFDRRLGLALSCAMVGVGLGAIANPQFAQALIEADGWRVAYRILAVVAAGGGALAFLLLRAGEPRVSASLVQRSSVRVGEGRHLGEAVREYRFWAIALMMVLGGAGGLGVTIHLVALLSDRGVAPALAASATAWIGAGVLIGRLGGGALMDFVGAPLLGAGTFVLAAIGTFFELNAGALAFPGIAAGAMFIGLAIGAEGDFVAFAVRRYFGSSSYAAIYGCLLSAYSLGGVVGPIVFGFSFDRLGNYRLAMMLTMTGFALNSAIALSLGKYRFAAAVHP